MNIKIDSASASPLYVRSVERAFAVLNVFSSGTHSMSLSEIAGALHISKSAAQRFTYTLSVLGYLRKDTRSRRWSLTPRTLDIGTTYIATDELIQRATPHLIELNKQCRESVNLSRPDGLDMVFLARFTSHEKTFVQMPVGTRIPMFCTASGRAYMAKTPDTIMNSYLASSDWHAFTNNTLTDPEAVVAEIEHCRSYGYARAVEEFYIGDLSVAAPVLGSDGRPQGAVNVSCPTSRWSMDRVIKEITPLLVHTARTLSGGLNVHRYAKRPERSS